MGRQPGGVFGVWVTDGTAAGTHELTALPRGKWEKPSDDCSPDGAGDRGNVGNPASFL